MPPIENDTGKSELKTRIQQLIDSNQVLVFSKSYCPYCVKVRYIFRLSGTAPVRRSENFMPLLRSRRAPSNCWLVLCYMKAAGGFCPSEAECY